MEEEWRRFEPEPYHTSSLTGKASLQELPNGHRNRMKDSLGVRPYVFQGLEQELISKRGLQP